MKFPLTVLAAALLGGAAQPTPPRVAPADLLRVMRLEPGRWQTHARVLDIQVRPAGPDAALPPGAAAAAREAIGFEQTSESCIGAGLADDGALVLPGIRIGADGCDYEALEAANGRLRLATACRGSGFRAEIGVDATYAPASMTGTIVTTAHIPAGGGMAILTTLSFESRHAGACR